MFSFLLFFVPIDAWANPQPHTLLEIFCSEITYLNQQGGHLGEVDQQWDEFVDRLERRQPLRELVAGPKASLDECLHQYASDFERAEFILGGREVVRKNLDVSPERQVAEQASIVEMVELEGDIGKMISIGIKYEKVRPKKTGIDSDQRQRAHRYDELWQDLLQNVRQKLIALHLH